MNKNKYCFEPVEIKIKDQKLFADVAFAIDSPYFIKRAQKIRKNYGITTALKDKDCWSWAVRNIYKKRGKKISRKLFNEIDQIRIGMNLTVNYGNVFVKAVFGCNIENYDYELTFLINFQSPPKYFYYSLPKSELYAIVLTPQTRKKDVEKVFKEYEDDIKKIKKDPDSNDIYDDFDHGRGNLKLARKWYWMKYKNFLNGNLKKPKTYPQVLKEWQELCPFYEKYRETPDGHKCQFCLLTDINTIEQVVPKYKRFLKKP